MKRPASSFGRSSGKDFISDTVYNRYSIGSPCVDPETKRVYLLSAYGVFICTDFDGKELWRQSLMEEIGRMTFPNSKVGAPIIEGDLVIFQGITSNWGADGPPANRFYAFDKMTGELVWSSTPGEIPPKDSSHSTPVLETRDGKRVFWVGTGCGNIVCVNARTGKPLLRHKMSKGGVNGSVLLHKGNKVIAIHGEENPDSSDKGRLIAIKLPEKFDAEQMIFDPEISPDKWKANEVWRAELRAETSSPTLAGDHVYHVTEGGELASVNADTGAIEWTNSSPTTTSTPRLSMRTACLSARSPRRQARSWSSPAKRTRRSSRRSRCEGQCLGSPIICNGQLYVHIPTRETGSSIASRSRTAASNGIAAPLAGDAQGRCTRRAADHSVGLRAAPRREARLQDPLDRRERLRRSPMCPRPRGNRSFRRPPR